MKKHVLAALALVVAASPALANDGKDHGDRHGKFFEKVDANKDNKISRAEFQVKGDQMFAESDANKDGFITREEGKAAHEARRAKWKAHKAEMKQNAGEAK